MTRKTSATGRLENRTQRSRLRAQRNPHWMLVAPETHLGYRPATSKSRNGTWVARRAVVTPEDRMRYREQALGAADDHPDSVPDGTAVLTFHQAAAATREWARDCAGKAKADAARVTSPTVRSAIADYLATRKARSARAGRDAELRLSFHVLGSPLADKHLSDLTERDIAAWRDGLKRGGRGASKNKDSPPLAPASLARLLNDFRAALTAAGRKARLSADKLSEIHEGLRAPTSPDRPRPTQILPDADVRRIVDAAFAEDDDTGALVLVLAATGCRFDQAARLTVADLQVSHSRIMVPVSRKGRSGTKPSSHTAIPLPADVMARLRPLIAGRRGHEALLSRWHHRQVSGDKAVGKLPTWVRDHRRAWRVSAEMTRSWRSILATAELPGDLVPYCLRHSSIVRGLRAGLPVRLVAAAHDTSVAMIERHYGAFIVDAAEDLLRRAAVSLAPALPEIGATSDAEIRKRIVELFEERRAMTLSIADKLNN